MLFLHVSEPFCTIFNQVLYCYQPKKQNKKQKQKQKPYPINPIADYIGSLSLMHLLLKVCSTSTLLIIVERVPWERRAL